MLIYTLIYPSFHFVLRDSILESLGWLFFNNKSFRQPVWILTGLEVRLLARACYLISNEQWLSDKGQWEDDNRFYCCWRKYLENSRCEAYSNDVGTKAQSKDLPSVNHVALHLSWQSWARTAANRKRGSVPSWMSGSLCKSSWGLGLSLTKELY